MVKHGYLKYKYTLTIDLENLVDRIMSEMGGYYDTYEFEGDGDKLVIRGEDTTYFKEYITPATPHWMPLTYLVSYRSTSRSWGSAPTIWLSVPAPLRTLT